jgi:hypothetical protein
MQQVFLEKRINLFVWIKDGVRNVGIQPLHYTVQQPRKPQMFLSMIHI